MASAIVAEVVKYIEALAPNRQAQVLDFVRKLDSTQLNGGNENDGIPSVAEVVARIQALSPNPAMVTQPKGSLADALRDGPTNPDFDLQQWEQEWAEAEAELKRIDLEDAIADARA